MRTTMIFTVLAAIALASGAALAVDPPGLMNYQGVLRDDDDVPLDGTYDMVFRFFDDADPAGPENEIFIDEHLALGTGAVTVTDGLFDVVLGSGNFYDGSGPGDHPHIYYVFGLHETVYLEVQIGAETLQPRMQVVSAPYAIHAAVLGGYTPSDFINTTSEEQEKIGLLRASGGVDFGGGANDDLTAGDVTGLTSGPGNYADFLHSHNYADNADTVDNKHASDFADAAHGHSGSDITGPVSEATNADTVDGMHSDEFINTSWMPQTKSGTLFVDAAPTGSMGIYGKGSSIGGHFLNQEGSGYAYLGDGDEGVDASGSDAGGHFRNSSSSGHHAYIAWKNEAGETFGVWGRAASSGGHFQNSDSMSKAWLARTDAAGDSFGVDAEGGRAAGHFRQISYRGEAYLGYMDSASDGFGVWAEGNRAGGHFRNRLFPTTEVNLGYVDPLNSTHHYGVWASGDHAGGHFKDSDLTSDAYIAYEGHGVEGYGDDAGGFFAQPDGFSAYARLGYREPSFGHLYGIVAAGGTAGGKFYDADGGSGEAELALGDSGIWAKGDAMAGSFENYSIPGSSATALLGVNLFGSLYGIHAQGEAAGGFFSAGAGSGHVYLGYGDRGLWAVGSPSAGTFSDTIPATNVWADMAFTTGSPPNQTFHKVTGNGQVGFVQNHPEDPNQVIVYAAPEGDETAVYTRGTARLMDGEARVALGETFQWVTNPDLGLTAYVTPRDEAVPLAVVEVTPWELVVRGPVDAPADLVFDYIVYGLRIGFERSGPVQAKWREAPLPSPQIGEEFYALPGPAPLSALKRFTRMTADVQRVAPEELDLSGATALREAIRASDWQQIGMDPVGDGTAGGPPAGAEPVGPATDDEVDGATRTAMDPTVNQGPQDESTEPASPFTLFPVSENVEVGDVLVLDKENPGMLRRADVPADANAVGIASGEAIELSGVAQAASVAGFGFVTVKADAGYGEIRPGDLLTSSFTSGHAMRAIETIPGTIVGKALDPLDSGTGSIRVLVMPR